TQGAHSLIRPVNKYGEEKYMLTVCDLNMCSGCGLCAEICPKNAINIVDDLDVYNAVIHENKCISCNSCHKVCPNNNPIRCVFPSSWYQGWAVDDKIRQNSSSGGFATAISYSFVKNGGIVCSCVFSGGKFCFDFAYTCDELGKFTGSKYVKSDPQSVYKEIKDKIRDNYRVLFIGLPCQVASIKRYVGDKLGEQLYTIDLICHGTPSPKLLELFLKQYGLSLDKLNNISFRHKFKFQVDGDCKSIVTDGVSDRYSTAFLNGLTYTENCYNCIYAQGKRVSDLTIGDSWGSEINDYEIKAGISLVLCMSEKGSDLLKNSSLHLEAVDLNNAIFHNHQLESPVKKPDKREVFFGGIKKGYRFNNMVYKSFPKQCLRQDIKGILIKMHIIKN
ncbi:MAG: Coenzyme F420 hydrogenase/dehydrogenase, beta subunit C-terminal domain, partial [Lachnospiraceae bacterium]|nr:Coenzyme F420 hydrogenase/dehydrogenase, beta subunit C-terminal domain [Lachnospiraceae bacterium]